jgi:hypothetical protein
MGYIQNLSQTDRSFYKVNSALAFYMPLGKSFSFAIRAGGGTIAGDADYYHLNKLSGNINLRALPVNVFMEKQVFIIITSFAGSPTHAIIFLEAKLVC